MTGGCLPRGHVRRPLLPFLNGNISDPSRENNNVPNLDRVWFGRFGRFGLVGLVGLEGLFEFGMGFVSNSLFTIYIQS